MKKTLALLSLTGLMVLSGCCCKKKADAGKCTQKTQQQKPCDKNKSCDKKKCDGKQCDKKGCDKKKDMKKDSKKETKKNDKKSARLGHPQFDDAPGLPLVG